MTRQVMQLNEVLHAALFHLMRAAHHAQASNEVVGLWGPQGVVQSPLPLLPTCRPSTIQVALQHCQERRRCLAQRHHPMLRNHQCDGLWGVCAVHTGFFNFRRVLPACRPPRKTQAPSVLQCVMVGYRCRMESGYSTRTRNIGCLSLVRASTSMCLQRHCGGRRLRQRMVVVTA